MPSRCFPGLAWIPGVFQVYYALVVLFLPDKGYCPPIPFQTCPIAANKHHQASSVTNSISPSLATPPVNELSTWAFLSSPT